MHSAKKNIKFHLLFPLPWCLTFNFPFAFLFYLYVFSLLSRLRFTFAVFISCAALLKWTQFVTRASWTEVQSVQTPAFDDLVVMSG
jgi:hypothetical protein